MTTFPWASSSTPRRLLSPAVAAGVLVLVTPLVAGCQSAGNRSGVMADAGGVAVSVEAVNGAPETLTGALKEEIGAAAASRQVTLVKPGDGARYRVIGYLAPETTSSGAPAVSYVWDVFSADKRRAHRVSGQVPVARAGSLETLDSAALRRIADESMNEIATVIAQDARPSSSQVADADEAAEGARPALGFAPR